MTSVFKFISKDMLRGLGLGFLVSALLVMGYPDENGKVQLLTDAEIKAKAKELGMVEKKEAENVKELPSTPTQPKEEAKTEPKPTQPPKSTPVPNTKPIAIVIPKGAYLSDIANILYQKGAIKDKNQFINLADSLKLSSKFNVGTYSIPPGAKTLDVINILIKRK